MTWLGTWPRGSAFFKKIDRNTFRYGTHNQPSLQPEYLTAIVETSNIVFSAIFAVEMLLKVTAEGPFGYISNGFNVFDGVIVILRYLQHNSSTSLKVFS